VLGRLPKLPDGTIPAVPVLVFPQVPQTVRADPAGAGAKYRVPLINQVLVQCETATAARSRTVTNAVRYLSTAGEGLLDVARRDLAEYDAWKAAVDAGKAEFEQRYRREFLSGEQFRRFDRYRERLIDLLELPGAGRMFGNVMWVLRAPYRLVRDYVSGLVVRPTVLNLSEQTVLSAALMGWLDRLQAESLARAGSHSVWKGITHAFETGLATQARDRFQQDYRAFELKETDDLEHVGQQMVDALEKHPALLYSLRAGKLGTDLSVVVGVIVLTWVPSWYQLLLIPLGVSATHQAAELVARGAAEAARARVRHQRESLVASALTGPLAEWLAGRPASGGTSFERLQRVLKRVPESIRELAAQVTTRVSTAVPTPALTAPPEQPTA
jgi:hypothetical protein